jgi:hypothetical protein
MHVKFKIIKYLCISIIYILYMYTNVLIYIYIYCIWSNDLIPKYIAILIRQRMPSMYFQTCFTSVLVNVVAYFGELKDNPNVLCNGVPLHPLLKKKVPFRNHHLVVPNYVWL